MSGLVLTGATGFLGGVLLKRIRDQGRTDDVIVLSRRPVPELSRSGVRVEVGSLLDPGWVRERVPRGSAIIHMAGRVGFEGDDERGMYDIHVEATRVLARVALERVCSRIVVLTSSGAGAVSRHPRLHIESDPYPREIIARWPYYQSKMIQERLVLDLARREALPAVVVAPSLLLGPGDVGRSSTDVVLDFVERRLSFVPAGGISIVDARDVADAVLASLERGRPGERYFLGSLNCRFSTFFEILEKCSGVSAPALAAPRGMAVLGSRIIERFASRERAKAISPAKADMANHFWYVSWEKAARELGFQPRRPEETIRDTIRFAATLNASTAREL